VSETREAEATTAAVPSAEAVERHGLRRLFGQVVVYGSGRLSLQLFSLITLPILTRVFTPADYGVIEVIATFVSVVGIVATLALNSSVQRSYFDYVDEQEHERRVVVSTGFWASLVSCTLFAGLCAAASKPLSQLFFGTTDQADLIALALAALPLTLLTGFLQDVLRLRQRPGLYVGVSLLGAVANVALVLVFVVAMDLGLRGLYLGGLVAAPAPFLAALALVRRWLGLLFSRRELGIMLAYALPLLPVAGATWILQFADRFFVLHYASERELGLYGVGVRLSNVLLFAVTAFAVAWAPFILELYSRDRDGERIVRARAFSVVGLGLTFGAVCLAVWSREFLRTVTDPSFEPAYQVVGLMCASVVALGLNGVTMTAISLTRQTRYFARYAVYSGVANIVLNFALIPTFGIVGAAAATFLSYAYLAALYYFRAQTLDRAPFDLRALVVGWLVAAALIAVGSSFSLANVWLSVIVKLPLVLAFPLVAWRLGLFDERTRDLLRSIGRRVTRVEEAPA
jgi:O-antigen/teichoic acid export membrane protein